MLCDYLISLSLLVAVCVCFSHFAGWCWLILPIQSGLGTLQERNPLSINEFSFYRCVATSWMLLLHQCAVMVTTMMQYVGTFVTTASCCICFCHCWLLLADLLHFFTTGCWWLLLLPVSFDSCCCCFDIQCCIILPSLAVTLLSLLLIYCCHLLVVDCHRFFSYDAAVTVTRPSTQVTQHGPSTHSSWLVDGSKFVVWRLHYVGQEVPETADLFMGCIKLYCACFHKVFSMKFTKPVKTFHQFHSWTVALGWLIQFSKLEFNWTVSKFSQNKKIMLN